MKYVYLVLNWLFGIVFIILGITSLFTNPLASVPLFIISLLLLPPVRVFVQSKTGKEFSLKARAVTIIILFVSFGIVTGIGEDKKRQELAAQKAKEQAQKIAAQKKKTIEYYIANKATILNMVRNAIAKADYKKAVSTTNRYLITKDPELRELHKQARTNSLLKQLKTVVSDDLERDHAVYKQLFMLHPQNTKYKNKYQSYSKKIIKRKEKQRLATERKENIKRQFSSWDGSHRNLERYIKSSMNDPDSYKHVETRYADNGSYLTVSTTFRGKNAFGGVVKNTIVAKISLDGEVLGIIKQY